MPQLPTRERDIQLDHNTSNALFSCCLDYCYYKASTSVASSIIPYIVAAPGDIHSHKCFYLKRVMP